MLVDRKSKKTSKYVGLFGLKSTISGTQQDESAKEETCSGKEDDTVQATFFDSFLEIRRSQGMECVSLGPGWEEMDIGFLSTQDIRSLLSPICVFTLLLLHFKMR